MTNDNADQVTTSPVGKLPFIFARMNPNRGSNSLNSVKCWVVVISEPVFEFGFTPLNEYNNCLIIPENTIEDKRAEKVFPTYIEARKAVRDWWIAQK